MTSLWLKESHRQAGGLEIAVIAGVLVQFGHPVFKALPTHLKGTLI